LKRVLDEALKINLQALRERIDKAKATIDQILERVEPQEVILGPARFCVSAIGG
jgi:hypothetical protein